MHVHLSTISGSRLVWYCSEWLRLPAVEGAAAVACGSVMRYVLSEYDWMSCSVQFISDIVFVRSARLLFKWS